VLDELDHVSGYGWAPDVMRAARAEAGRILRQAEDSTRTATAPVESQLLECPGGQAFGQVIADDARAWQADLIVIGTHGRRGIARAVLGSGAEQVIRQAPVPVMVVRAQARAAAPG